jgi:hypothetical protein
LHGRVIRATPIKKLNAGLFKSGLNRCLKTNLS